MRHPVNALGADLKKSSHAAREAKATELYGKEDVRLVLTGRASAGFEHAVIPAPDGLDLRQTRAALALLEWLRGEKLTATWEARAGAAEAESGTSYSLVVTWKASEVLPSA